MNHTVQDRKDAYKKEIDVYSKMYYAKAIAEQKGEPFDEKGWLTEKGFDEIAETHFEFGKNQEKEIVEKYEGKFRVSDIGKGIRDNKLKTSDLKGQRTELEQAVNNPPENEVGKKSENVEIGG